MDSRAPDDGHVLPYRIVPPAGREWLTPIYDALSTAFGYGCSFLRWLIAMSNVRLGQTVLDLGCGTGTFSVLTLQRVPDLVVYSADPWPSALRAAQRNAARSGVSPRFFDAHAEALPFERAMFDSVLCILTLHHIPDTLKAAAPHEVRRVLKPDGRFLLADFETKRNLFFWGKYRSSQTLECWLSIAAFKPESVGRWRGVPCVYRLSE